jgi:hypothetical protein
MFITENIPAIVSGTFTLATTYKTADHFVADSFICVVGDKWRHWWLRVERAYGSSCGQCSAATGYALLCAVWPSAEELTCQNETAGWLGSMLRLQYVFFYKGNCCSEGCWRGAFSRHKQKITALPPVPGLSTDSSWNNKNLPFVEHTARCTPTIMLGPLSSEATGGPSGMQERVAAEPSNTELGLSNTQPAGRTRPSTLLHAALKLTSLWL